MLAVTAGYRARQDIGSDGCERIGGPIPIGIDSDSGNRDWEFPTFVRVPVMTGPDAAICAPEIACVAAVRADRPHADAGSGADATEPRGAYGVRQTRGCA